MDKKKMSGGKMLERERSSSLRMVKELAKRKRDSSEKRGKEPKREKWFKRSNKTQRTLKGVKKVEESEVEMMRE